MTTSDAFNLRETGRSRWAGLTIADGLLALVIVVGAALRLADLGGPLLRPAEAAEALAVWQYWQPGVTSLAAGSPAFFTLTSLLTQFLGFGEAIMRLAPALAGISLVGLPWLLRHRLGAIGTLAASLMLATSPTAVAVARTAGGESLALAAGLLLFIAWLRYQESGARTWLYVAAGAIGAGLATAPVFYGLLLTIAGAWLIQRRFGPTLIAEMHRPEPDTGRRAAIIAASIFAIMATFFLWQPAGFGAALTNLGGWLGLFRLPPDALTWLGPVLALGRYETGIMLLGTIAIGWATWRNLPFPSLLVYWFSGALLLLLLQGGAVVNVLLLVLPGYLLLAVLIQDNVAQVDSPVLWPGVLALLALLLGALANTSRHFRITMGQLEPQPTIHLFGVLFCLLFVGAMLAYLASWRPRLALAVVLWSALILMAGYGWGSAWWLGHDAHNDARERWVETGTDPDVRSMLTLIDRSSRHATGNTNGLAISSSVDSPVLRWYLRDRPELTFTAVPPTEGDAAIIITTADAASDFADGYVGQTYGLRRVKTEPLPSTNLVRDLFAWWFFHDSDTPPVAEPIIFWLRNDLLPGQ